MNIKRLVRFYENVVRIYAAFEAVFNAATYSTNIHAKSNIFLANHFDLIIQENDKEHEDTKVVIVMEKIDPFSDAKLLMERPPSASSCRSSPKPPRAFYRLKVCRVILKRSSNVILLVKS